MLLAASVVDGCTADPYPLLSPPGAESWHPASLGTPVRGVVLFVKAHPGDRIELLGAEPIGVAPGADVRFYASPTESMPSGGWTTGEKLEPLAGATVTASPSATDDPYGTLGVVAEVTARVPGTYTLSAVRLHFRVNGGGGTTKDGISEVFTVCGGDPAPGECGPTPPA